MNGVWRNQSTAYVAPRLLRMLSNVRGYSVSSNEDAALLPKTYFVTDLNV